MVGTKPPVVQPFGLDILSGGKAASPLPLRWHLAVFALYLALAAVVLWPLLGDWSHRFVGPAFGASQVWQMRQVWGALLAGQLPPFETTLLSHPNPGLLIFIGWPFMVAGFFLRLFVDTVPAMNGTLIVFLAAGGYSMFLLGYRVSRSVPGALLAGTVYGYSAYAISAVGNGHVYSMFVLWLPLLLWCYDRYLSTGRRGHLLCWGVVVLLAFAESPYRLVEGVPLLGVWTVSFLFLNRREPVWPLRRVGWAAIFALIAISGPLFYFGQQVTDAGSKRLYTPMRAGKLSCEPSVHPVIEESVDVGLITEGWLDPVSLVRPGCAYGESVFTDRYNAHHVLYLGLVIPLALLCFLVLAGPARRLLLWGVGVGFLMALGPAFHFGGHPVCVGNTPVLAPMAIVLKALPGLEAMGAHYRIFLSVIAALALALALGWPRLVRRLPRWLPWPMTCATLALLMVDVMVVAPLRFPVPVVDWQAPSAVVALADAPGDGAVLVVPDIYRESLRDGEERVCGFLWQMEGDKPFSFAVPEACAMRSLLNLSKPYEMPRYDSKPSVAGCRLALQEKGIAWVLFIGENARVPGHMRAAQAVLHELFGPPRFGPDADGTAVYQVDVPAP
jgi:hypothetical protein